MKFKSPVYSMVSGSLAGLTYAHNRGGMYARARSLPTNPNTEFQESVRDYFRTAVVTWTSMEPGERETWETWAANTPIADTFGDPRNLTGQQAFIRASVANQQSGLGAAVIAPTIYNLGDFTAPVFTPDESAGNVSIAFTNTDAWATEDDGFLSIKVSRPQNPSINFFKGPFRYLTSILGDTGTPPTSPSTSPTMPFAITAGQKLFFEVRAMTADGRLTTPFYYNAIVVA